MDSKTIGQFTGLVDSTGKEIYEDDIISSGDGRLGIVEFHNGSFVVNYGNNMVQALYDMQNWNMTILGNRFENPELILESIAPKNATDDQELGIPEFEAEFISRE